MCIRDSLHALETDGPAEIVRRAGRNGHQDHVVVRAGEHNIVDDLFYRAVAPEDHYHPRAAEPLRPELDGGADVVRMVRGGLLEVHPLPADEAAGPQRELRAFLAHGVYDHEDALLDGLYAVDETQLFRVCHGNTSSQEVMRSIAPAIYAHKRRWRWGPVSYTHLRAHETRHDLVCRLLLEKKKHINKQL